MSDTLKVGSLAPDFTLEDQDGLPVHLADRIGKHVIVLFFYPKDNSAGCTIEACSFRDSYQDFQDAGADVIGISGGSTESKQQFMSKNRLPYTLVTDVDGKVAEAYTIGRGFFGLVQARVTFVIDRDGIIRHRFESNTNMDSHSREALKMVQELVRETVS